MSIEEAEKRTEMDCLEEGWRENEGLGDRKWEDTGEGGGGGRRVIGEGGLAGREGGEAGGAVQEKMRS